jgi:hypothetical protein
VADRTEPGDCPPRSSESKTDPMAQVFTSPTTKYEAFSSATTLTTSSITTETPSSSSVITSTSEPPFTPSSYVPHFVFRYQLMGRSSSSTTTPSSSSSPSTSTSTSTTSESAATEIVKIVTLTRMKSSSRSTGGDAPSTISSSEDLIRSTALSSGKFCRLFSSVLDRMIG